MNSFDRKRILFDAISEIDPMLIQEAADPPPRSLRLMRNIAIITAAAAAIAILIANIMLFPGDQGYVTMPKMLVIRAYALDQAHISAENSTVMEEGVVFPLGYAWSQGMSCSFGLPFHLSISDKSLEGKAITWEIKAEDGIFYLGHDELTNLDTETSWVDQAYLGNNFTVDNNTLIQWNNISDYDSSNFSIFLGKYTYVEAIVRADNNIIGYAVIKICGQPNSYTKNEYSSFLPILVDACYYPMVDGEFQEISETYINRKILNAKLFH